MKNLGYDLVTLAAGPSDLEAVATPMFWLMFRNVASDGFVFQDPIRPGVLSEPGCILASPSWENSTTHVRQDYVYHWTRDAAVVAFELAAGPLPTTQTLIDYVHFSRVCQTASGDFDRASFLIDGTKREWSDQSDGPAIQTLAVLALYSQLDSPTRQVARDVIDENLAFLHNAYPKQTVNLWEEETGQSFFARAVQLRCFQAIAANTLGIAVPAWVADAITWLEAALAGHWNGSYYRSVIPSPTDKAPYDPNIDIICAAIYGAVPVADPKLLATAALIHQQWSDPASPYSYPINQDDAKRTPAIGPLLGRYPGDRYDGDTDVLIGDHPWALSTANFAELYYRLAHETSASGSVPQDPLAAPFLTQVGVRAATSSGDVVTALRDAGDRMLHALILHSDHLELSEQFDAFSGYEKSVRNLSWSYAAFLSAMRARTAI